MIAPDEYYDSVAENYHLFYDGDLFDLKQPYPANYFRLQLLLKSFADRKNVLDVGCGDGMPLSELPAPRKYGLDISPKMVKEAGKRILAFVADITKPETYQDIKVINQFDGIICAGVMPHIHDTVQALTNIKALLEPGGKVFIEFRNDLFNLFAYNRLTVDFVVEKLIEPQYRKAARNELGTRLKMDLPRPRPYDAMLAKYHNPFEVGELFEDMGFQNIRFLWYHYHPTIPYLDNGLEFRKAAMAMEGKDSWKSMFICSAFVVEANI